MCLEVKQMTLKYTKNNVHLLDYLRFSLECPIDTSNISSIDFLSKMFDVSRSETNEL